MDKNRICFLINIMPVFIKNITKNISFFTRIKMKPDSFTKCFILFLSYTFLSYTKFHELFTIYPYKEKIIMAELVFFMCRFFFCIFSTIFVFYTSAIAHVQNGKQYLEKTNRYASISVDINTLKVFHAKKATQLRYPASLTKMMTLYCLFEQLKSKRINLTDTLTVSVYAASQPASKLNLNPYDTLTVQQAILALIIKSANDVAVLVAESLAQNEKNFANYMTQKAKQLGMKNTQFKNASGLHHPQQYTTALDMALLAIALIKDFPEYYTYFSRQSFQYKNRIYYNHNQLLGNIPGVDGLKTGYIDSSGYNLAISALRDQKRIIAVVLGGKTARIRNTHMVKIIEKSFSALLPQKQKTKHINRKKEPQSHMLFSSLSFLQKKEQPKKQREQGSSHGNSVKIILKTANQKKNRYTHTQTKNSDIYWSIQTGSFYQRHDAERTLQTLEKDFPDLFHKGQAYIQIHKKNGKVYYRSRLGKLKKKQAENGCALLQKHTQPCLILLPKQAWQFTQ